MAFVRVLPITIIIPCYSCASTIGRAFKTILWQTMLPAEVILVDDFSDDDGATLQELYSIRNTYTPKVKVVVLEMSWNEGPGSSRNMGWAAATQPYIAFLDADDTWHPKKLEIQYEWMRTHPQVTLTGHLSLTILNEDNFPMLNKKATALKISSRKLLLTNMLPTRSVMLKRSVVERFYPGKRHAEDYLLWLQISLSGSLIYLINLPLSYSHKADFGHSGLNANLKASIEGVLDTYRHLFELGQLSASQHAFYNFFAKLKHFRRQLILTFRRLR